MDGDLKLCYVDGPKAYFTTQPLDKQWGDDWDDAPYEHNAGPPYEPCSSFSTYDRESREWKKGSDYVDGVPKWQIVKVYFDSPLIPPSDGVLNSAFSVQSINRGDVAWLRPYGRDDGPLIKAGVTLDEFRRLIRESGGVVYLPETTPCES